MPYRSFLRSKIHGATLTAVQQNYMGSVSVDPELLRQADIAPYEQVDVYNVDNGERLTTYAIEGEAGEICLNGAAALKGEAGQRVIIASYVWLAEDERAWHTPKVVFCGPDNAPMMGQ